MTEVDELLERLRRLEPIAPDGEFSRAVQARGRRRLRGSARQSAFAPTLVIGTVVTYLGWAVHFASALYR